MTTQDNVASTLNASRSEHLSPYLDLLRPDPENGRPEVPPSLVMDGAELALDTWERTVLQKAAALNQDVYPWSDRVAEGLAFLAWSQSRLADHDQAPRDDRVVAVAIGLAVLEDLQRDVDGLILAGRVGLAKQLTGFRHKVNQDFGRLKDTIGPADLEEAESLSRTLVPPVTRFRPTLVEEEPEAPQQFKREIRLPRPAIPVRTTSAGTGRLRALLIGLMLTSGVWIGFTVSRPVRLPVPEVDPVEFRSMPGVTRVVQRPPSLFVTVEDTHWRGLNADRKRELVQGLVEIVSPVGYRGIHVRLVSGAAAAQWLEQSGVRLFESTTPS